MRCFKCIGEHKGRYRETLGYYIQDDKGVTKEIPIDIIKEMIKNNKIVIDGLTLTNDGLLVKETKIASHENKNIDCWSCKFCKLMFEGGPKIQYKCSRFDSLLKNKEKNRIAPCNKCNGNYFIDFFKR